jgi:hypothetical protein
MEDGVMKFEFARYDVMTALCVVLARVGFAQRTVADRPAALSLIQSTDGAGTRVPPSASILVASRTARSERPALRCRWQCNLESGRLEARWMTQH